MRVASLPIINAPVSANPGAYLFIYIASINNSQIFLKRNFYYSFLKVVDIVSTPRRDLAPPIEEDEEPESESQGKPAPLRQIENNISALLRGDLPISVRVPGNFK